MVLKSILYNFDGFNYRDRLNDIISIIYIDYILSKSILYTIDAMYTDYIASKLLYNIVSMLYRDIISI